MRPLVLVSGFEPFETHAANPSGEVAAALAAAPPAGIEVRSTVLPVSFDRSPRAWDELAGTLAGREPALALGLGVQRHASFRLEGRARGRLRRRTRPDVDGVVALASTYAGRGALETTLDLERAAGLLRAAGAEPVVLSRSAGGYVCERIYYHLLAWAGARGVPGLFLHVPPAGVVPSVRQAEIVRRFLPALVAELVDQP